MHNVERKVKPVYLKFFFGTRRCLIFVTGFMTLFRPAYDDVITWKHYPPYWPYVRGIHRSSVNSPHKGQWRRALMFSLICVWINGWVSNGEAGDLRRYRAHYDVTIIREDLAKSHLTLSVRCRTDTRDPSFPSCILFGSINYCHFLLATL